MASDSDAAIEQYARMDLPSVLKMIAEGNLDLTRVIFTPDPERTKKARHINLNVPTDLFEQLMTRVGSDKKYGTYYSTAVNQYIIWGLILDNVADGLGANGNALLIKTRLEAEQRQLQEWSDAVDLAQKALFEADGDPQKQRALRDLQALQDLAVSEGRFDGAAHVGLVMGAKTRAEYRAAYDRQP